MLPFFNPAEPKRCSGCDLDYVSHLRRSSMPFDQSDLVQGNTGIFNGAFDGALLADADSGR